MINTTQATGSFLSTDTCTSKLLSSHGVRPTPVTNSYDIQMKNSEAILVHPMRPPEGKIRTARSFSLHRLELLQTLVQRSSLPSRIGQLASCNLQQPDRVCIIFHLQSSWSSQEAHECQALHRRWTIQYPRRPRPGRAEPSQFQDPNWGHAKDIISGPLGSAVERVTSNDKVVSSTLAVGIVVPWPPPD